ncbi:MULTISPECIES: helix-turn-helix transcriptional regulator [Trichocoleus]|uniref:Helix-turn-helix transcriptional regulator n=1 Tax=Trichocoleus desertorum GB2-A4 TaxID=2933944 RepID=A0ABV0JE58_9CYAN|nr:helix-turn-helix transcriptional regulator [Trichocoleus sp. FACHB-46]MBD1863006.1 helix-turn-helix transcriptional regulator [Trichocoleus sp. FACHB-46]
MIPANSPDYTHQLRSLMQPMGVSSFKALAQKADVSEWQVRQLRQGRATQMRAEALIKLSQALKISLPELISTFSQVALEPEVRPVLPTVSETGLEAELVAVKLEYERSQAQLAQQREALWQEFQQSVLQAIESWLLQWPTAAYAAQQNPQAPAVRLLPLLRPIETLLQQWGIEAIAEVGMELPYDPTQHQLMEGIAQPGDRVRVRYTGYRQEGKLLYRAKVSPVVADKP